MRARLKEDAAALPDQAPQPSSLLGTLCRAGCETARRESRICRHNRRLGRVPRAADAGLIAEVRTIVKNKAGTMGLCSPPPCGEEVEVGAQNRNSCFITEDARRIQHPLSRVGEG